MDVVRAPAIPASLASWPGYLLSFIAERTAERFERALGAERLKGRHAALLVLIDAEGAMSQRQLGRRLGIDKSIMVGLLDDLERLGYVRRRRNASDRRAHDIELTAAGLEVLARAVEIAERENERTFGILDADEREQLHALLRRVAEASASR